MTDPKRNSPPRGDTHRRSESRPQGVTLAATYLIAMGGVLTLAGGTCTLFQGALVGGTSSNPADLGAALGRASFITGVAVLVLGVLSIGAGSGSLAGRPWARWTGAVISVVLAIVLGFFGVTTLASQHGGTAAIVTIALGVLYALSAYALVAARSWFGARR